MEGKIIEQEDFDKIFTELLEYVGKKNFEISKDQYSSRIHKKGESPVESQIFAGDILDDKKRIIISIYDSAGKGMHNSTDKIISFLDEKDCVYDISND